MLSNVSVELEICVGNRKETIKNHLVLNFKRRSELQKLNQNSHTSNVCNNNTLQMLLHKNILYIEFNQ